MSRWWTRIWPLDVQRNVIHLSVLTVAFFFVIGSQYVYRMATAPLIVKAFGAKGIPAVDLTSMIVAAATSFVIMRSRTLRWRLSWVLNTICVICIVLMLAFPTLFNHFHSLKVLLTISSLCGSCVSWCGNYAVWMLLTSTIRKPNTLDMTVFGAGAQVGVLAASALARSRIGEMGVEHLAVVAGMGYVIAFSLIAMATKWFRCYGATSFDPSNAMTQRGVGSLWRFRRLGYFELIGLAIAAQLAFGQLIQWNIYRQMECLPTVAQAATLLATFNQYLGIITLVAQVTLVPFAYRFITPRYGLLIQPLLGVASMLSMGAFVSASGILLSVASYRSLEYTLNNCMREALYSPIPTAMKIHQKPLLAILAPRVGKSLSAVFLLLYGNSNVGLIAFGVPLLGIWLALSWRVTSWYRRIEDAPRDEVFLSVDHAK